MKRARWESLRRLRTFARVSATGLLLGLLVVASAAAQTPQPTPSADDVNRVAAQMYCPVCENEPLDVCQTSACIQWKAQIGQYLAEGRSDSEIVQIFVDRFGLRVKADPLAETPLLWIGPIVVAVLGGIFALVIIRRMTRRGRLAEAEAEPRPAQAGGGDEYADRVERELQQRL